MGQRRAGVLIAGRGSGESGSHALRGCCATPCMVGAPHVQTTPTALNFSLPALLAHPSHTAMSGLKSPAPTLTQLRTSLEGLQGALSPLSAGSLEALAAQIEECNDDGKLQSAQLHVSLAYVVLDLVWILLKVAGVDPLTHPVTGDLQRVQEYLTKVHKVSKRQDTLGGEEEQGQARDGPAPVDKGKVGRFLRHALGAAASGKRTIFADDGSVERIVDAGTSKDEGEEKGSGVGKDSGDGREAAEWEQAGSKKAKRQAIKADKALRKASNAMKSKQKKPKK